MTTPPSIRSHYRALEEAVRKGEEALTGAEETGDLNALTSASKEVSKAVQEFKEAFERNTIEIPGKGKIYRFEYEALEKVARDNTIDLNEVLQGILWIEGWRVRRIKLELLDLTDISGLSWLTGLNHLALFNNKISDLSPLSVLTALTKLWLFDNEISDLSPLSRLTDLAMLNLAENRIYDLSSLSGLTRLIELNLCSNQITDLTPLKELKAIQNIYISSNPLANTKENTETIAALKSRGCNIQGVEP